MAKTTTHADYTATALTLTTAAQPNITSVGTLTSFRSTGIDDNADATAITIDSSENVSCVGNITLGSGAGSNQILQVTNDNGNFQLQKYSDDIYLNLNDNGSIIFRHYGSSGSSLSTPFTIIPSGNVGIGQTSPTTPLHVESSTSNENTTLIKNTAGTGVNYGLEIQAGTNATDHALQVLNSAGTSMLRVTGGGNVGIGTTSPAQTLHVSSSAATSNGIRISNSEGSFEARVDAGEFYLYDVDDARIPFLINTSGNIGINTSDVTVGASSSGSSTATPNFITFNNNYSNGYTDASLKLYLYNLSAVRQGFTSGPAYDLQYHSSGHSTSRHSFYSQNTEILRVNSTGLLPGADNTYDLGSTSAAWQNIYTNDLNLSNEGGNPNEVDGTTGNWTIQEGANDLFIINRLSGKKYKFNLIEVTE